MKIKYAIYQNKIGLRAVEYADTKKAIKDFPYIKEKSLPVIINAMGGYTHFDLEHEKENGFLKIIEVKEGENPLTREQQYPKNSINFEYGWISPEGDTYHTGLEGHSRAADAICEEFKYPSLYPERYLEEHGWLKITGSWSYGILEKMIYTDNGYLTKPQSETLFELGLWENNYVQSMIRRSEKNW